VVVGDPVRHSLSPAMHNAAITALGLDAVYVPLPVPAAALAGFLDTARHLGLAGNVTVPHKIAAAQAVSRRTPLAERLGAINTFWTEGGVLVGDNTDVPGVLDALAALDAAGPWLVTGTGGSARAVAVAAGERGVSLLVRSRQPARAAAFVAWAAGAGIKVRVDDETPVGAAINATPLGLAPGDVLPIPLDRLKGCRAALDLVYVRGETKWVAACRGRGMRARDGRDMLVAQGLHAFTRFFPGATPPREVMAAAVEAGLR
jgi:shikimate dehydrogenase